MNESFLRVLVVAPQPFNYYTGFGITASNLFSGWPVDRLACLYYEDIIPDTSVCGNSYRLTKADIRILFPLNILSRKVESKGDEISPSVNSGKEPSGVGGWASLKKGVKRFSAMIGIGETLCLGNMRRYYLRESLRKWLIDFKPDVLYCSVTSLSDIALANVLIEETQARLVVHIMDDWIEYVKTIPGLVPKFWARTTELQFVRLLNKAHVRMGIGNEMCREYNLRYGKKFVPFQNCPESALWIDHGRKEWGAAEEFRFVFTGAVYDTCNSVSMLQAAKAIDYLNRSGRLSCILEIHTNSANIHGISEAVSTCRGVMGTAVVSEQAEVAELYGSADALFLPFDFTEQAWRLSRFSMPTKLPAYMLSASPIFVYGPDSIAAVNYVDEARCGYVVKNECSVNELAEHLEKFCSDVSLRREIALRAQELARVSFSAEVVRPLFVSQIFQAQAGGSLGA